MISGGGMFILPMVHRVEYLELGLRAIEMMRPKEAEFKELGLSKDSDDETLIAAMAKCPKLIKIRPIGRTRMLRQPPLTSQMVDKLIDGAFHGVNGQ